MHPCHFERSEKSLSRHRRDLMPKQHHYFVYLLTNWNGKVDVRRYDQRLTATRL